MKIGVVTLYPEAMIMLNYGVTGRAIKQNIIEIKHWNPQNFTIDKNHLGNESSGNGSAMMIAPFKAAAEAAKAELGNDTLVIYLSSQGNLLNQESVVEFVDQKKLILLTGGYEGVDESLVKWGVDAEFSIGNYVLNSGELAACVIIDAIARLLPGVLGNARSAQQDSFSNSLLDYPHYTRPDEIAGCRVPDVLRSGDHADIAKWRLQQSLGRTFQRRPELLAKRKLMCEEQALLAEFLILNRSKQDEK